MTQGLSTDIRRNIRHHIHSTCNIIRSSTSSPGNIITIINIIINIIIISNIITRPLEPSSGVVGYIWVNYSLYHPFVYTACEIQRKQL